MQRKINVITYWLAVLTVILAPLYVVRWNYPGGLPTTLLELCVWLTVLSWIIGNWQRIRAFKLSRRPLVVALGLLILASIVSTFISPSRIAGLGILRAYFIEPAVFAFIIFDLISHLGSKGIDRFYIALRISAIWVSVLGLMQVMVHFPIVTPHQADRAHAVFNNGNALALYVGPILVIEIARLLSSRQRNKWGIFATILMGGCLLATRSLGGAIGAVLTIVIWWLVKKLQWSKILSFGLIAGVTTFLIGLVFISQVTPSVDNPWVRPGGTATVRLCLWEGTRNLLYDHLLLGSGLTGFQSLYSSSYTTCDAEPLVYPHNWILNAWTETGLLGLVAILAVLFIVFRSRPNVFTPFFIYFALHGLVDVPYFKNDLALLFWVALVLWHAESTSQTVTRG